MLPVYKQATQPFEARVADLISRMTVEEKVGQLICPLGWEMYTKTGKNSVEPSALFKEKMKDAPIGSFWAVLHAEPRGYLAGTQSPDGTIHIVSSRLHYRFNQAWLEEKRMNH